MITSATSRLRVWYSRMARSSISMRARAPQATVPADYRDWGYDSHPPTAPTARGGGTLIAGGGALCAGATAGRAVPPDFRPSRTVTHGTWAETEGWQHHLDTLLAALPPR
jgi:hypothetical protein